MTTLNIDALEQSFEQIKPRAMEFAASFYRQLLTDYPQLQPLFADTNMEEQEQKLVQTLATIILNLRYPETLAGPMRDLGERHARYGTIQEHYPMVADALLKTFANYLGDAWTDEVRQAWIDAYAMIVELMLEGAKRAETSLRVLRPPQSTQPPLTRRDDRLSRPPIKPSVQKLSQPANSYQHSYTPSAKQPSQEPIATPSNQAEDNPTRSPRSQPVRISEKLSRPITTGEVLLLFSVGAVLLLFVGFLLLRGNTRNDDTQNRAEIQQLLL